MDDDRIIKEMQALEDIISYHFNDIKILAEAMNSTKVKVDGAGQHAKNYVNDTLATVGDAVVKLVIADYLKTVKNYNTKGKITSEKQKYESNKALHNLIISKKIIDFAYNDKHFNSESNIPKQEQVVHKKHDAYMEAIAGAIYYDQGYECVKEWMIGWLKPMLEKYQVANNTNV